MKVRTKVKARGLDWMLLDDGTTLIVEDCPERGIFKEVVLFDKFVVDVATQKKLRIVSVAC